MIIIKIETHQINLYKDDSDSPIYSIRKDDLWHTRIQGEHIISDWIPHLMLKTWIEKHILYKLATVIQKEFPDNKIDWSVTFFQVEKSQYLNHVKKTKHLISSSKKSDTGVEDLFESIEIGVEEQNDFVNSKVSEIVKINLQNNKLI
ncbi:MAG: hypothetical protein COB81_07620 [Flavobacteriaceae bacterium]|nr:MAG: hypothetical protein COB81_07620 [Flavobacteriaceae bacterium]